MADILTIIEGAPQAGMKEDLVIERFVAWYKDRGLAIHRASSVKALREVLFEAGASSMPFRKIQIVGHGAPGLLSLGWTWTRRYKEPKGPYYLLDGNQHNYRILSAHSGAGGQSALVPPSAEVCLVGCYIGHEDPLEAEITVANGDTLAFDLAQMWGCTVSVASEEVDVTHLDSATGEYVGPGIAWTWGPSPSRQVRSGRAREEHAVEGRTRVIFKRLVSAPVLAELDEDVQLPIRASVGEALEQAFTGSVASSPLSLLAMPELVFDVEWEGKAYRANLMCRQRVLQILANDEVIATLIAPPSVLARPRAELRSWLATLAGASGLPEATAV